MPDGTQNADTFNAPAGNSNFNGLGGVDTIVFNFALTSATFNWVGNQVIIDTATSHTVLTGFEIYQFTDGTVNNADGSPLIDDLYYNASNPDVWAAHTDADAHYNANGWHEKRNPNAFFNTALYLSLNPDVAASGTNPLSHFDTSGWKEGRTPGLNFDVHQYLVANPDVAADNVDPLRHFLATGAQEGRQPFPAGPLVAINGFDYNYYLTHNPDVAASGGDAFQHFQTVGWKEGRNPNAFFDVKGYLQTYPDIAAAGVNPLDHYHQTGFSEGRNPSPMFDTAAYLAANPDVKADGVDPLQHYLRFGINEGRVAIPTAVFDENAAANTLAEGAANGSNAGVDVSWGGWLSPNLSFSLSSDTSGGGFTINTATGQITVADSTKLDFETSGASHSYTIVVVAQDGSSTKSQAFTINITDVVPTTPVDGNAFSNTVFEGAANGSTVGVTLFSDEPNGPPVVYELTNDAGGLFTIDSATGVVTVANSAGLDFETGAHSFTITGRTKVGAVFTPTQDFTITLLNAAPSPIADSNVANETVNEGAAVNTLVGIDADSTDPNGPVVTWSITSDSSNGGFKIDSNGVVSIADASKINYESAPGVGHSYSIIVQAADGAGGTTSRNFSIVVNNVNPTTPVEVADGTPGGSVTEGAAADTLVGVQASASDVNGPAVTWSITSDPSGGGFKIDSNGVISVADASKINYKSAPGAGHSYDVTVQASDGEGGTSTQTFNILVANVGPTTPTEVPDGTAGGSVLEGAAVNTLVGITASSSDVNGPAVTWSITADSSTGGFKIDSNGVVSVADASKINYENAPGAGRSYDITVQASDGFSTSSQSFNILVGNVNPGTPTDGLPATANTVVEGATAGTLVGIDADALDPNGPAVSWSILSGSAVGGFTIDPSTGVVSVLNGALLNYETAPLIGAGPERGHTILVQASDGQGGTSTQTFTIEVTNAAPAAPTDTDPVGNSGGNNGIATFDATAGTLVGIHAQSTGDPAGGTVTYELTGASSAFFQINASTGEVSVSSVGAGSLVAGTDYDIFVVAKDSTGLVSGTSTATPFKVHVQGLAPAAPTDTDTATNNEVSEAATGIPGNFGSSAYTGVTAHSTTVGVTYSIIADSSGGGFQIASDGKIYVANGSLIDYESAGGSPHHYTVTVQVSDGSLTSSSNFDINVVDVAPTTPTDTDASAGVLTDPAQGRITFNAANGANVGITVHATDIDGGALTYELVSNPGSRFAINSSTGVVTLADNTGLVAGTPLTFSARAVSTNGDSGTGTNVSAAQSFTVEVVANQPVVDLNGVGDGGIDFANTFAEGAAAVLITDTDAAVVEPGFTNLTSATITLTNAQIGDALAVGTPGALSVNTVSGGGKITVTLSGNQPFSVYETALRSISFNNTNNAPVTGDRIITVVVNDGVNPPSNAATSTITVSATNDTPVLTLTLPDLVATPYQENAAPVALATSGTVADPDAPTNFNGGSYTVEITGGASSGDQIVLLASSGFSATGLIPGSSIFYNGIQVGTIGAATALGSAKVTIVLDDDATPLVVNALSAAFAYQSVSDNPAAGIGNDRTVTFTFNDGGNTGAPGPLFDTETQTVRVTAVNDAPVIGNLNGNVASFTEGAATPAVLLDTGTAATVTDVDSANFATGTLTVSITANEVTTEDVLGISEAGTVSLSAGTTVGSIVSVGGTPIGTIAAGGTGAGGDDLIITFNSSATPALVETLVQALTYDNTNGTTASTDTRGITITLTDGDGGSTSVNTTVAVTEASNLTGQLWYVTRDGLNAGDNVVGHINSDGASIVHFDLGTDTINDIALDTSADLYFLLDSLGNLTSYHLGGTTALDTEVMSGTADAIVVDSLHNTVFVTITGVDAASTGIQKYTYDAAGLLTAGDFLLTQDSLTTGTYVQAIDLSIDLANQLLYYVDSDATTSNGIYVVDYTDGSNVATDLTAAESLVQFALDGSEGYIEAVAVDNRNTPATTDDIIYFLTNDTGLAVPGTASLWYLDRTGGNTTPALVTGAPTLAGVSTHTGLVFDPVAHQLYISNQDAAGNTDSIIQVQLDAAGTTATGSTAFDLTTLTGQATPSNETIPGQTAFDTLPVVTVNNTSFTEGTPVVLDPALTISDPDGLLSSVTVKITGGFAGNGDALSFDTTGTGITGPASPVVADGSGNITVTFTGRTTLANYMGLLDTLTFNSGENPTNFGANTTRTVSWHFDDGAAGDPHSAGNTKTSTINITAVNDAPTLDVDTGTGGDYIASYHVGDTAVAVTGLVDIFDADTATIQFATVKLTNAQVGDVLAISGALPAGITAAIVTDTVADPDTITVTLTGPASLAAFEAALHQVVFSSSSTDTATQRSLDISVDDGQGVPHLSNVAVTKINLADNAPPVAWDDAASATEAGGLNNAVAGSNPSGNVFADNDPTVDADGDTILTNDVDFDAEDAPLPTGAVGGSAVVVTQVTHGVTTVAAGTTLIGTYGAVTINANGSYSYSIDQSNAAVQALAAGSLTPLHDQFTYTIRDTTGATDTAVLDITINGADDFAQAVADTGSLGEDAAATLFAVRANDTVDPDTGATNAITILAGATAVGNGAASGLGIGTDDFSLTVVSNQIQVTLTPGSDFQKLAVGDTATITVPYRLAGDSQNSDSSLTITVNGANDLPVANDDTGSMGEDAATTAFTVLTGPGADVLDVDRGAPTAATVGAVTTGTVTAVGDGAAAGKVTGADVTVGVNASNQITVSLGANFQKLAVGETATITVGYLLHGDGADTDAATLTVTVNGANDAPIIDLSNAAGVQSAATTATFTENGPLAGPSTPVTFLPQLTVTDPDGSTAAGATVHLNNIQTGDVLTVNGGLTSGTLSAFGNIGFTVSGSDITFTGSTTLANYQSALQLVEFNNTSQNPNTTARTFAVNVDDGSNSGSATATVNVVAVNDNPANTVPGAQNPVFSDTDSPITGVSITDVDGGPPGVVRTQLTVTSGKVILSNVDTVPGGALADIVAGANNSTTITIEGTTAQINSALATLKYHSNVSFTGTDSLQVLTNDQGNTGTPGALSDTDSISIGVVPKVWFIDNTANVGDDPSAPLGSQKNPFTSIAAFNLATTGAAANEFIYLRQGTYTEDNGIVLKNGQTLIGQGETLSFTNPFGGADLTIETGSIGQTPIIQLNGAIAAAIGIDLASNNIIKGLNVVTSLGTQSGIDDGNNAVGNLNITNVGVTGTGKAVDIDQGGALTVTLNKLTSTGSGTQGIDLSGNVTGSFTVNDNTSTISGAAGTDFNISTNGLLNVTFNGGMTQANNAAMVSIAGGHTGTVTFQNGTLSATNGTGLQFDNADGTYNFNGTTTLNGGNAGIDILNGSGGTFGFGANTSITNASGTGFNLGASTANVTYSGSIAANAGLAVDINGETGGTVTFQTGSITSTGQGIRVQNDTAGTVNFNNATITLNTGASNGVTLASNGGAIINFNLAAGGSGLDITTAAGTGFSATGGGTVTVLDPTGAASNSINAGSGTGLNITGTQIGSGHVTFESISSGGGANTGITLNGTGTAAGNGGLHVTGTTTAGSGGTIANKTGADSSTTSGIGIYLTNTKDVQLAWMQLNDFQNQGILGNTVTGFALANSVISGTNGTNENLTVSEGPVFFTDLFGTASVTNTSVGGAREDTFVVINNSGTLNRITFDNVTFGLNSTLLGDNGLFLQANNAAILNATVQNSNFVGSRGDQFQFDLTGTASGDLIFNANDVTNAHSAVVVGGGGITLSGGGAVTANTTLNYDITNNTFTGARGDAILVVMQTGRGSASGNITGNTIGVAGTNGSGSSEATAIEVRTVGQAAQTVLINNNQIHQYSNFGVLLQVGDQDVLGMTGSPQAMHATVTNNTIDTPNPASGFANRNGFHLNVGTDSVDTHNVFLNLFNNNAANSGATDAGIATDYVLRHRQSTTIHLSANGTSYGGGQFDTAAVSTFVQNNNIGSESVLVTTSSAGGGFTSGTPSLPLLMAAAGQGPGFAGSLTYDLLSPIVAEALHRWAEAGITSEQMALLNGVNVTIGDLGDGILAGTSGQTIAIDHNAAGWGWFVDPSPADNAEFALAHASGELAAAGGNAAGHIDLLTAILHEMGHAMGLEHSDAPGDVMEATVDVGIRRLPDAADAADAAAAEQQPGFTPIADAFAFGQDAHAAAPAANAGGFDAQYYLAHNPDVAAAGVDPLTHYESFGWHEGRNPNAHFDTAGYLAHYADVAAAGVDPLQHYVDFGWHEGRDPSAAFDTNGYLVANPDVAAANVNPLVHYLLAGFHEGRTPINDGLWHV